MTDLLRLVAQLDPDREAIYDRNPHAGLIVCRPHLEELQEYGVEPMGDALNQEEVTFYGYRCELCVTPKSEGRVCTNEDCAKPLHPNWPAVYCSNRCALEDM